MLRNIPLDKAELLAIFLESIFYGIFLTFFILLVVISFGEKQFRLVNQRFILPVATVMMIIAAAHLSIDFVRIIQAFVSGNPNEAANPIAYYEVINHPLHSVKTSIYTVQTLLGDTVLVWRCYIVYNKSFYVLIPAGVVLLTNLAIGTVVCWSVSAAIPGRDIFQTAAQYISAFFIITMTLNLCCTGAIAFKIWITRRATEGATSVSLFPVFAVIVESGAIYTSSVLGLLIAFLCGSNGQYAALDIMTPIVGIVYCLIVLQIHFHLKISQASRGATSHWSIPQAWRRRALQGETTTTDDIGIKTLPTHSSVTVRIAEHVETRTERDFQRKARSDGAI